MAVIEKDQVIPLCSLHTEEQRRRWKEEFMGRLSKLYRIERMRTKKLDSQGETEIFVDT